MKKLIAIMALALCASVQAGSVQLKGVVTDAPINTPIHIGDELTAHIVYNGNTHQITMMMISVGNQFLTYGGGGEFTYDTNPCDGVVFYRVEGTVNFALNMSVTGLAGCTSPTLEQFTINEFELDAGFNGQRFTYFGPLTSIPKTHP